MELTPEQFKQRYYDYINSDAWTKIRKLYYNSSIAKKCYICDVPYSEENLDLHHLHYNTFMHERIQDLVYLCRKCHELVHETHRDLSKLHKVSIKDTTNKLRLKSIENRARLRALSKARKASKKFAKTLPKTSCKFAPLPINTRHLVKA